MLTLYQFEISPFCDKVRRVLNVKGLDYRTVEVPVSDALGPLKRINPAGKLPALDDDGTVIADSTEIARYVDEKVPDPPLLPADPALRAQCHVLEDWADESLFFYEVYLRFGIADNAARFSRKLAEHERPVLKHLAPLLVPRVSARQLHAQGLGRRPWPQVQRELRRNAEALSSLLVAHQPAGQSEPAFLLGATLTVADIAVFAQLHCVVQTREGNDVVAAHPTVTRWLDRVDAATRPS